MDFIGECLCQSGVLLAHKACILEAHRMQPQDAAVSHGSTMKHAVFPMHTRTPTSKVLRGRDFRQEAASDRLEKKTWMHLTG